MWGAPAHTKSKPKPIGMRLVWSTQNATKVTANLRTQFVVETASGFGSWLMKGPGYVPSGKGKHLARLLLPPDLQSSEGGGGGAPSSCCLFSPQTKKYTNTNTDSASRE